MAYDLILRGGRVLDPSQNIDRVADVAFAGGRVAAVGEALPAGGAQVEDVRGLIVTPGLIDLHTHVYWGGTSLGIDADDFGRRSGVTTCVDTGSAGPGNFPGFRKHVIERSDVRILAYLHISFAGIFAFGRRIMLGESLDSRLIAVRDTVEVIEANRDVIVGVKVRIGRHTSGENGIAPLESALQAAEQVGLPVMVHIDEPPPSYEELCDRLRPGDVLTHCFRPFPKRTDAAGRQRAPGGAACAGARRAVRHRPRQGLLRLRHGTADARRRVPARHHLLRHPHPLHRRPGL